jgi:predicted tellurium resistance membrane protein TerC
MVEGLATEKAHDLHLKNYIYFAMAFSVFVEILNIRVANKRARKREAMKAANAAK